MVDAVASSDKAKEEKGVGSGLSAWGHCPNELSNLG